MKNPPFVVIAGATGVVGQEMISLIGERRFPCSGVRLLASRDSVGEVYQVGEHEVVVEELTDQSFEGVDIALFATSADLSEKFAPVAVESGAVVIDNSSRFRMQADIPLIVPEVNRELIAHSPGIIANPNCSTIQLVPILRVLHEAAGLRRVVVSTYQSVSGAGKNALDELWNQTRAVFTQQEITHEAFQHQIAFNCIPQIDLFRDDGYTLEEAKIINESRKILGLPELKITATAVRVPVFHAHAESVNVELERSIEVDQVKALLQASAGIAVLNDDLDYPMQLGVSGQDEIFVGRIRRDMSVPSGLDMWIVADNIRKGAALNALQIAEALLEKTV